MTRFCPVTYNPDGKTGRQCGFAIAEGFTPEEALKGVHRFSRDNARTPMQWDGGEHASFTADTPWLPLLSSCGAGEAGQLRPLEAVIYGSEP